MKNKFLKPAFYNHISLIFLLILSSCSAQNGLEKAFVNPPESAGAHTWWHWVNGNVTKEGITKDLESFKKVGLSGFQLFDVGLRIPHGGTVFNSKEYHDKVAFAIAEADRLGLEMGINSASGWSSTGGPWIKPKNSMKVLVWSEKEIHKKTTSPIYLELPELNKIQKEFYFYEDIAILAFPKPKNAAYRISNWEAKSLTDLKAKADEFTPTSKKAPKEAIIKLSDVVILTDKMDANGKLNWTPPSDNWTVVRIGYTTTAAKTRPASKGGIGLELDKLSKEAVTIHWEALLDKTTEDAKGSKAYTTILIDSYEVGHQNWTDNFEDAFQEKRGYDLTPRLLCATGRIIESNEYSERVLWDFRKTVADEMYENYFKFFKEKCHENGLKLATEAYGSGSFDAPEVSKLVDIPMTEFWHKDKAKGQRNIWKWTSHISSSAAHLSGRSVVGAEAFTRMKGDWSVHPYNLKIIGDKAFTEGINRYYFHTSAHQPWNDNIKPGMTMSRFGSNIHRNNTWFYKSKPWLDYIARCQFIMQTGTNQADALVMYGDERGFNNFLGKVERLDFDFLEGYKFDVAGIDSLDDLSVGENGEIRVSYEGKLLDTRYRILSLKRDLLMRIESIKKLGKLAQDGAIVIAQKPIRTPGIETNPNATKEFNELVKKYWDSGLIHLPSTYKKSLSAVTPDCKLPLGMEYAHHKIDNSDFYFVSNQCYDANKGTCTFRVTGKQPELWDPETGKISKNLNWKQLKNGTTEVQLDMTSAQSIFVVFQKETKKTRGTFNSPTYKTIQNINGDWNVTFNENFGTNETILFKKLTPWNEHTNEDIKYYSGTATYKTNFEFDTSKKKKSILIDLGQVAVIAEVKLNGKDLGTLWKPPFQIEIKDVLKKGENTLEVKVTNLWPNRLIGDAQYPNFNNSNKTLPSWLMDGTGIPATSKRKTYAAHNHYKADAKLLNSGLMGPVKILTIKK
ncbi:glycosyl hydrolase [Algibacter miyuki]|uniref:Glycosyl hydrolase n=1 Tax=Algibacter miyuki TaxID=1306933 RepID=A0ABV5H4M5_9FLAO|nr:glycosyl hydrolase [Algibacter miyuki]MDN3663984.1 glycosyl hydrolase [Algibacter miyuki]